VRDSAILKLKQFKKIKFRGKRQRGRMSGALFTDADVAPVQKPTATTRERTSKKWTEKDRVRWRIDRSPAPQRHPS
jgi:hypothetical protein